jgi:hypothetical protein
MIGGRVPQATVDAMDAWARANGLTRSTALASLIDRGCIEAFTQAQGEWLIEVLIREMVGDPHDRLPRSRPSLSADRRQCAG